MTVRRATREISPRAGSRAAAGHGRAAEGAGTGWRAAIAAPREGYAAGPGGRRRLATAQAGGATRAPTGRRRAATDRARGTPREGRDGPATDTDASASGPGRRGRARGRGSTGAGRHRRGGGPGRRHGATVWTAPAATARTIARRAPDTASSTAAAEGDEARRVAMRVAVGENANAVEATTPSARTAAETASWTPERRDTSPERTVSEHRHAGGRPRGKHRAGARCATAWHRAAKAVSHAGRPRCGAAGRHASDGTAVIEQGSLGSRLGNNRRGARRPRPGHQQAARHTQAAGTPRWQRTARDPRDRARGPAQRAGARRRRGGRRQAATAHKRARRRREA